MSEIKLCKDCKHFRYAEPVCGRADLWEMNLVYGNEQPIDANIVNAERQRDTDCGRDAKYFEPMPVPVAPPINYFAGLDPCVPSAKPWWKFRGKV